MGKISVLTALLVLVIGFGIPAFTFYFTAYHGFDSLIAGIIIFIALIVALTFGILGITISSEELDYGGGLSSSEREKLNMMRASQRATLEEIDDVLEVLKEIRDLLKAAQE
jgi:hypothetical protein